MSQLVCAVGSPKACSVGQPEGPLFPSCPHPSLAPLTSFSLSLFSPMVVRGPRREIKHIKRAWGVCGSLCLLNRREYHKFSVFWFFMGEVLRGLTSLATGDAREEKDKQKSVLPGAAPQRPAPHSPVSHGSATDVSRQVSLPKWLRRHGLRRKVRGSCLSPAQTGQVTTGLCCQTSLTSVFTVAD